MNMMLRVGIFLAASIAILQLSWRSLRHPRLHGFYRFFAFELLASLILLTAPMWFHDPLSARQLCRGSSELSRSDWRLKDSGCFGSSADPCPQIPAAPICLSKTQPRWSESAHIGIFGTLSIRRCWRLYGAPT